MTVDINLDWSHLNEYMGEHISFGMSRKDTISFLNIIAKKMNLGDLNPERSNETKSICFVDEYTLTVSGHDFRTLLWIDPQDFNQFHLDISLLCEPTEEVRELTKYIGTLKPEKITWENVEWVKKLVVNSMFYGLESDI